MLAGLPGDGQVDEPAAQARVRAAGPAAGQLRDARARPGRPLDRPRRRRGRDLGGGHLGAGLGQGHRREGPDQPGPPRAVGVAAARPVRPDGRQGVLRGRGPGGRLDPPQAASASFAVNTAPEESNFEAVKEEQVREWLPKAGLTFVNASSEAQQVHGSIGEEREVWRPLDLRPVRDHRRRVLPGDDERPGPGRRRRPAVGRRPDPRRRHRDVGRPDDGGGVGAVSDPRSRDA